MAGIIGLRCSTSGDQSRVRALLDWYLGVLEQSQILWWNIVLVKRLRWSGFIPCSFLCRQDVRRFFYQIIVVTLDWSRLVSIIQSNDSRKSIDVSRDDGWQWSIDGFGFLFKLFPHWSYFLLFLSIDATVSLVAIVCKMNNIFR